jgi:hypothetical protein
MSQRIRQLGTDIHDSFSEQRKNGETCQSFHNLPGPPYALVLGPGAGVRGVFAIAVLLGVPVDADVAPVLHCGDGQQLHCPVHDVHVRVGQLRADGPECGAHPSSTIATDTSDNSSNRLQERKQTSYNKGDLLRLDSKFAGRRPTNIRPQQTQHGKTHSTTQFDTLHQTTLQSLTECCSAAPPSIPPCDSGPSNPLPRGRCRSFPSK